MTTPDSLPPELEKDLLRRQEIEHQLHMARSNLSSTRAAAVRRLGELRTGVDAILDALRDPSDSVRIAAAGTLGAFSNDERSDEIADALLSAIDDANEKVCQSAIRSLGMLRVKASRPEVEIFLDDPNPYIVGTAILALGRLNAVDLAPRLAGYLNHESTYIQTQAVRAVSLLGYTQAGPKLISMIEHARRARQAAARLDPQAVLEHHEEALYTLLNQLVRAAGELRLQEAVPLLLDIAQKDVGLRGLAIEALMATGAEIAPETLTGLLADPSAQLRRRLMSLVTRFNYRPALPLLRKMLEEDNAASRSAALYSLAAMQDAEALPQVEWLCYHDPNPFVRIQAVKTLAAVMDPAQPERLLPLTCDANFEVRRTAVAQLLNFSPRSPEILAAFDRFAAHAADDEISAQLRSELEQAGYRPGAFQAREAPTGPWLPEEILAGKEQLLEVLQRWYNAAGEESTRPACHDILKTRLALEHLIRLLTE